MPSSSSGVFKKMLFNDGEGVDHLDFNDLIHLAEARIQSFLRQQGNDLSQVQDTGEFGHNQVFPLGIDLHHQSSIEKALRGFVYAPYPYDGIIRPQEVAASPVQESELFVELGLIVYRQNANMTGTKPIEQGEVIACWLGDEDHDLGADLAANAPPGGGDPRWDTLGVRLNYEIEDTEVRDIEDAVTRALSTLAVEKRQNYFTDYEYATGAQQVGYTQATLSAGYVPLITIRRPVADADPHDPDNFYYNAYPMRLGVEDIVGHDLCIGSTGWTFDTLGQCALEKVGAGDGTFYAVPRQMPEGARLVGVGIGLNGAGNDARVDIGTLGQTAGVPSYTALTGELGAGGPLSLSVSSWHGIGEDDWSPAPGTPLPIWGNGLPRGPLFSVARKTHTTATGFNKLAVRFREETTGVDQWAAGARINMVRLIYLY